MANNGANKKGTSRKGYFLAVLWATLLSATLVPFLIWTDQPWKWQQQAVFTATGITISVIAYKYRI